MQVTILQVFREEKQSKAGKPYTSIRIKTQEHGDKWLSGFGNALNKTWTAGATVEVEVEEKGQYLNFKDMAARAPSKTWDKLNELESRIQALEHKSGVNYEKADPAREMAVEKVPGDLPF